MRRVFALLLVSCFLNVMGSVLQAEEAKPQAPPTKSIVFLNRASFHCDREPMPPGGRPSILIYPDMTIEFDSLGNYSVSFAVESPKTDVTLNLEFLIPYTAQDETTTESQLVEGNPPHVAVSESKREIREALVVVPPIRIPKDEKSPDTTQYSGKQLWVRGHSVGLALAHSKAQATTYVPASGKATVGLPSRNGRAKAGTFVK